MSCSEPLRRDNALAAPAYLPPVGPTELHKADEFKKRRGPVSCAECRRLKLKCDRKVPCSSCSKRGCAAICPNGTLSAGPGNRYVLADTQHLHEKIDAMSKRIVELEDALAALQAQLSNERHPLLADELMIVKAPLSTQNVEVAMHDITATVAESLGTLTLGDRAHFFGANAAADYLLAEETQDSPASASSLPLDLILLADTLPFTNVRELKDDIYCKLVDWLPVPGDAASLVDTYYTNAAWMFNPMPREELLETVLKHVYPAQNAGPTLSEIRPHDLAVLCMVFAMACISDMNRPPYSVEASNYYQLARVALGLDSVIDHPTLQAVRSIQMMTTFLQMLDHPNSATTCYMLLGLGAQVCQSLGLHRDDTQWDLADSERQKRRHVFWELVSFDSWSSLAFGRPPAFSSWQVDAKMSEDTEQFVGDDGTMQMSFRMWNHMFTRDCLIKIMDQAFGVTPLTYATVLRLDRMVREHPINASLRLVHVGHIEEGQDMGLLLQRNTIFALTQKLLLYLHRSFFAEALVEHPADPLKSKYAQSVLASFRCAFYITASARALYAAIPLSLRFWMFWSQCFSACVILGSIVIRSPGSGLAPAAWVELDRVYELFEQVAPSSQRIMRMLPKMRRLREKAHEAYTAFTTAHNGVVRRVCSADEEMELRFLWGRTRLVDNGTQPGNNAPAFTTGSGSSPQSSAASRAAADDVFASLFPPPAWDPLAQGSAPASAPAPAWSFDPLMGGQQQPTPMDSSASFYDPNPGSAHGMSALAAAAAMAPPVWSTEAAMAPLDTPSPETGANALPGRTLDATWQRFMDGIGLPFVTDDAQQEPALARAA